jgi:hypothetical protein
MYSSAVANKPALFAAGIFARRHNVKPITNHSTTGQRKGIKNRENLYQGEDRFWNCLEMLKHPLCTG